MATTTPDCIPQVARCVLRGNSDIFTFTLKEEGTPVDITGYTANYAVRPVPPANSITDDTSAEISAIGTIPTGTDGLVLFNIPPDDTRIPLGDHLYDIKLTNVAEDERTYVGGTLTVVLSPSSNSIDHSQPIAFSNTSLYETDAENCAV